MLPPWAKIAVGRNACSDRERKYLPARLIGKWLRQIRPIATCGADKKLSLKDGQTRGPRPIGDARTTATDRNRFESWWIEQAANRSPTIGAIKAKQLGPRYRSCVQTAV